MENSTQEDAINNFTECLTNEENQQSMGGEGKSLFDNTKSQKRHKGDELYEFLTRFAIAPLVNIFNTKYWTMGK